MQWTDFYNDILLTLNHAIVNMYSNIFLCDLCIDSLKSLFKKRCIMDVPVDSSSHPLYLDKEYDTKESFLAACIKHNASVGKECKTYPSNSKRARVTCCDASCEVSLMGDTLPFTIFVHLFCSPSYFSFTCHDSTNVWCRFKKKLGKWKVTSHDEHSCDGVAPQERQQRKRFYRGCVVLETTPEFKAMYKPAGRGKDTKALVEAVAAGKTGMQMGKSTANRVVHELLGRDVMNYIWDFAHLPEFIQKAKDFDPT